jgi:hypothetical protein
VDKCWIEVFGYLPSKQRSGYSEAVPPPITATGNDTNRSQAIPGGDFFTSATPVCRAWRCCPQARWRSPPERASLRSTIRS